MGEKLLSFSPKTKELFVYACLSGDAGSIAPTLKSMIYFCAFFGQHLPKCPHVGQRLEGRPGEEQHPQEEKDGGGGRQEGLAPGVFLKKRERETKRCQKNCAVQSPQFQRA